MQEPKSLAFVHLSLFYNMEIAQHLCLRLASRIKLVIAVNMIGKAQRVNAQIQLVKIITANVSRSHVLGSCSR